MKLIPEKAETKKEPAKEEPIAEARKSGVGPAETPGITSIVKARGIASAWKMKASKKVFSCCETLKNLPTSVSQIWKSNQSAQAFQKVA